MYVPILTVAIPAFNDAEALERTLLSFVTSFSELPRDEVELIVSDNASTDSTFDCAVNLLQGIANAKAVR